MPLTNCPKCQSPLGDLKARFCAECGTMVPLEAVPGNDPLVGRIVSERFRVLKILGEGGMGKVYLAEQRMGSTTRKIALKTLQPDLVSDPQLIARFHRETETVIQLQHPNTITFYEFGETSDGLLFIAMEYVQGESLAVILARGALEPMRVERVVVQICGSLAEAHGLGIVHRDLKPDNIVLTNRAGQTDFVKVLDFGIAKRTEFADTNTSKLTKQGMVLGTPPYMSPEQFTGQTLDARSDVYSLAVMVYEMLAGQLPFSAHTPWEWATQHLTTPPRPFESLNPALAQRLQARHKGAILHALAKNRDERPPSVIAFLQEFSGRTDTGEQWLAVSSARTPFPPTAYASAMPSTGQGTPAPRSAASPTPLSSQPVRPPSIMTPGPIVTQAGATPAKSVNARLAIAAVVALLLAGGGAAAVVAYMMNDRETARIAGSPTLGSVGPAVTPTPVVVPVPPAPPSTPTPTPAAVPAPVEPVETPAAEPPAAKVQKTRPTRPPPAPVSPQVREGESVATAALAHVRDRNLDPAISGLERAIRLAGRQNSVVQNLQRQLGEQAGNRVGQLLLTGRCPEAQLLTRRLLGVGAGASARRQFGDWCPPP